MVIQFIDFNNTPIRYNGKHLYFRIEYATPHQTKFIRERYPLDLRFDEVMDSKYKLIKNTTV